MLEKTDLDQLRRFARTSVNTGVCQHCNKQTSPTINKRGAQWLMEILDHYEQTIQPERVPEPETSDKRTRDEADRGTSDRSSRPSRNRRPSVRSGS